MSLGADVADHISAPGLLKNSPSAQINNFSIEEYPLLFPDRNQT